MAGPPYLHPEGLTIYYTEDSYLSRVLIFYWPVTTAGSNFSSRHRVTIFTKFGHTSFPPFQVSPQSPYYGAVAQLSDERQRDGIYRVMVFSLAKYFDTLPAASKENGVGSIDPTFCDDRHAGAIANKLCKVTNPTRVLEDIKRFYSSSSELQQTSARPPSSPRSTGFSSEQKKALRLAMCEVVDTEERYVSKMDELLFNIVSQFRERSCTKSPSSTSPDEEAVSKLFPSCLDDIFSANSEFLHSVRDVLQTTEDTAMDSIASGDDEEVKPHDALGIRAFSRVLCDSFPKFLYPYKEYLYAHTTFSPLLASLSRKHAMSSFSRRVSQTGEQKLRSMLMEPVQRLPRYSLLIDAMTTQLPAGEPSLKFLGKARDIISEICAMETPVSKVLDSLTITYEEEKAYRSRSPTKFLNSLATGEDMVVMRNVPRLAAPEEREKEGDRDRDRGRDRGAGGGLRRALSRRVSPPKKEQREQAGQQQVLKENMQPRMMLQQQQQLLLHQNPMAIELEWLRRENAELKAMLERCTCAVTDRGGGDYGY